MNLHKMLADAPDSVFDWFHEAEEHGYLPSQEDFLDRFGDRWQEWRELLPDTRKVLYGECDDEQFLTMEDELKQRGVKLTDFY